MSQLTDLLRASSRGGWPFRNPPNVAFKANKNSSQYPNVGWWPTLGNAGSNVLRDYTGKQSPITLGAGTARPTWVGDSKLGQVLSFDGGDSASVPLIGIDNQPTLNIGFWLKSPFDSTDIILELSTNFNDDVDRFLIYNTAASFYASQKGDVGYNNIFFAHPSADAWHHFLVSYDRSRGIDETIVYVDGNLAATSAGSDNTNTFGNDTLYIGSRAGSSNFMQADLADLRIWDYNLSAAEIYALQAPQAMWELYAPEIPVFYSIPVIAVGEYYQSAAGILTPIGVISKETSKVFTGSLTAVGSLVKQTVKAFTGSLTASGILVTVKAALLSIGGSLTPSGSLARQTGKVLVGSLTTTGSIVKQTAKAVIGSVTAVGSLATQYISGGFTQVVGGVLTMSGILVRQTNKQTAGIVTMAGSITRHITKTFTGVLTAVGTLARQILGLPTPYDQTYAIEAENRVYAIT